MSPRPVRQRRQPKPPFPKQHQKKPGLESKMRPRPRYDAPTYLPSGKLEGLVALVTGGDSGIGRAVAIMFAREGADVAISYLPVEQEDAEETRAAIESTGQKALLLPGDLMDRQFCDEIVEETIRRFGRLDVLVNNAAFQQHQKRLDDLRRRATGADVPDEHPEFLPGYPRGTAPPQTGRRHHQHGIDHGSRGQRAAPRLFGDERRDSHVHEVARAESDRPRHPRQLRGARSGLDAPQSIRQAGREGGDLRRRHAAATPGPAGRDRPRVRLLRLERGFELHHRRGPDAPRRRNHGRLTPPGTPMRQVFSTRPVQPGHIDPIVSQSRMHLKVAPRKKGAFAVTAEAFASKSPRHGLCSAEDQVISATGVARRLSES